jgi:GNAT superfamily N-acetyltransferase
VSNESAAGWQETGRSPVTFRAATEADAEQVAALIDALINFENSLGTSSGRRNPWAADAAEVRKQMRLPNVRFFVAEAHDAGGPARVVGYQKAVALGLDLKSAQAGLTGRLKSFVERVARRAYTVLLGRPRPTRQLVTGLLSGAYVVPEARRRGISTRLMAMAEEWLRAQGIETCETQVQHNNEAELQILKKTGYSPKYVGLVKRL